MRVTSMATKNNATKYFSRLADTIEQESLQFISFNITNTFFKPDDELGFEPY